MSSTPSIVISHQDANRLAELISEANGGDPDVLGLLDEELARAKLVDGGELPVDVVSMGTCVVYEDVATGKRTEVTLVYPHEADVSRNRVSVLSRAGSGLLGLTVGQEIAWPMPRGHVRRLRVIEVRRPPR